MAEHLESLLLLIQIQTTYVCVDYIKVHSQNNVVIQYAFMLAIVSNNEFT